MSNDFVANVELSKAIRFLETHDQLRLWFDESYPYPWQREFFDAGEFASQKCAVAANGTGKTITVAAELAMHLTGRYPRWWKGKRFDTGGWEAWAGSIDNDMQKRGFQRALLGRDLTQLGTGLIPADAIAAKPNTRLAGVKDVVDTVVVRHVSGRNTTLKFLTFEQGWRKWQSGDPRIIVWDEEPDETNVDQKDILSETLTRLVRNKGIFLVAYTPLLGETELTQHFMNAENESVFWVGATWEDAPHMDVHQRELIISQYPEHQREARTMGIPMMGEGRVFKTAESQFVVDPIPIPKHWARISGLDIGLAHPAASAWIAWDRDANIFYLYDCWKKSNALIQEHANVIKAKGEWIPVAWPHDGEKRDPKSGQRLADIYRGHELKLLSRSARYKNDEGGSQAVWPIIEEVRTMMENGQFKVFKTCKPWIDEYRSYHVKGGELVKRKDDVLKASFYAMMMRRFSVSQAESERTAFRQFADPAPFTTAVH